MLPVRRWPIVVAAIAILLRRAMYSSLGRDEVYAVCEELAAHAELVPVLALRGVRPGSRELERVGLSLPGKLALQRRLHLQHRRRRRDLEPHVGAGAAVLVPVPDGDLHPLLGVGRQQAAEAHARSVDEDPRRVYGAVELAALAGVEAQPFHAVDVARCSLEGVTSVEHANSPGLRGRSASDDHPLVHRLVAAVSTHHSVFLCGLLLRGPLLEASERELGDAEVVQRLPGVWMPDEACLAHLRGLLVLAFS
mmetsp:Transcript_61260/g.172716  ORF Transcript_61260/g.172716 Transcript_61260/m.172716 type:complete len:251 (+) Transcript_61260:253-1005(+)